MNDKDETCLLFACDRKIYERVRQSLSEYNHYLRHAASFQEALDRVSNGDCCAVLVELGFDGGRMFDLLKAITNSPQNVTVICFRGQPPRVLTTCDQVIATVVRLIANAEFWDLSLVPDGHSAERERERLGRILLNESTRKNAERLG